MRVVRRIFLSSIILLLLGCGKSRQLAPLLPDAPDGWDAGSTTNSDISGVGHSSTRSYTPEGTAASLGVQRVRVQILLTEKGADRNKVNKMFVEREAQFMEQKEVGGFAASESVPLPDLQTYSVDIFPKSQVYVQIVAFKGGPGWENGYNRKAAVTAFVTKVDLKKIAAVE